MGRDKYKEDMVLITHRGKEENIRMKVSQGFLPMNYPKSDSTISRVIEHSRPCVWISIGKPSKINYFFSGMIQYGFNLASVSFKVPREQIKNPDGIFKFVFSGTLCFRSQKVIERDVRIPEDVTITYKKGKMHADEM